ncbi:O-antigen ligase family protein [Kordiimonas sediminis]|uniref:O-antigen ligase family protein n=1 Tax=Kordiimonas sediminis TaxID=1735581 RepID=UPI00174BED07|nr:O-antigen ligase family protein [Kordiimonas sediminis]
MFVAALSLFCGFVIAAFATSSLRLLIPIAVIIILFCIWALPAKEKSLEGFIIFGTSTFVVVFLFFPPYLSVLPIPGNAWIGAPRIVLYLTIGVFLIGLSTSRKIKANIFNVYQNNRRLCQCILALLAVQFTGIFFSPKILSIVWDLIKYTTYTIFPFLFIIATFTKFKQLKLLLILMVLSLPVWGILAPVELKTGNIIYLEFMPGWAFGTDEVTQKILTPTYKGGNYRIKGPSITPLEFGELIGVILPITVALMMEKFNVAIRILGAIFYILGGLAVFYTGSRLGLIISIVGTVSYLFFWAVRLWIHDKKNLIGPAIASIYPAFVIALVSVILASNKLHNIILGGGDTAASTNARFKMWEKGFPIIFERPLFGHGFSTAATVLNYRDFQGNVQIDSYWLSVFLDSGLLGGGIFAVLFFLAIRNSMQLYLFTKVAHEGFPYTNALASSFIAFIVGKLVLSQDANHSLIYIFLAILCSVTTIFNSQATRYRPIEKNTSSSTSKRN